MDHQEVLWSEIQLSVHLGTLPMDLTVDKKMRLTIKLRLLERDYELLKITTMKCLMRNLKFNSLSKMVMNDKIFFLLCID